MPTQTEFDMLVAYNRSDALIAKRLAAAQLKRDTRRVNDGLYEMGRTYHDSVRLDFVNDLLTHAGFDGLEPMILCGRVGSLNVPVGRHRFLTLSWYKMDSGRYEVTAYVN